MVCPDGLVGCWPKRRCCRCRGAKDGRHLAGPAKRKALRLARVSEAKTIKNRKSKSKSVKSGKMPPAQNDKMIVKMPVKSVKSEKSVKMPVVVVVVKMVFHT